MADSNVIDIQSPADRDSEMVQLRVAGVGIGRIAKQYGVTERVVLQALDRGLPQLGPEARAQYLRRSVGQLDQLSAWWFGAAKTNVAAAMLCLKINERMASLLGLDAAQTSRLDPTRIIEAAEPQGTSTDALLRELNRIAAERPAAGELTVETPEERDRGAKAEALPEPPEAA
jgi:hypothetical protein